MYKSKPPRQGTSAKRHPGTRFLTRNLQPLGPPLVRGDGCWVEDASGNRLLDFCSQTLNLNLGHRPTKVMNAVREQMDRLHYASSRFLHPPVLELAEALAKVLPSGLRRLNLKLTSGSEANEGALKAVRKAHGKPTVAGFYGGFLGVTYETMRASGKYFDVPYLWERGPYVHVPPPVPGLCPYHGQKEGCTQECARWLEDLLDLRQDLAAVILEPILVDTAGVIIPPPGYLASLRRTCSAAGVALVFDEDQTAFGWLGDLFAADHYGVRPDLMTFGKGLACGLPLSAIAMRAKYDVLDYGEHEVTTGASPLSCAAALANLGVLAQPGFLHSVRRKGDYLGRRLAEITLARPHVEVRRAGLLAGLDVRDRRGQPAPKEAKRIHQDCLRRGLLVRRSQEFHGNVLILKPPLVISKPEIDLAVETLDRCLG